MDINKRRWLAGAALGVMLAASASHGALLTLGDDAFESVALGFGFTFFGNTYNTAFVGSNGYVTFGAGDTDFSESVPEFLNNEPRIAGWWDDLNPSTGGTVDATGDANSMVVTYSNVPEFSNTGANSFSITMFADGAIEIALNSLTSGDGIVGISPGGGAADPGAFDFSANPGPYFATGAMYEVNPTDLIPVNGQPTVLRWDGTAAAVPVPATIALMGLAFVGFGVARRRRS